MPEHDETDAPEEEPDPIEAEFEEEAYFDDLAAKRRKAKAERWGVEDKVVDGESK